nr:Uncharacterised protein [Klebsiella pneumoniae]
MAIARPQRHPYPPLHQRRGLRTHDCVIAPDGLLFGYIATHQAPGDNIAQFLGLILIELLSLYQRRDHQAGIFHVLAGDAGEGDGGHLTVKSVAPVVRAKVRTLFGSLAGATTALAMLW